MLLTGLFVQFTTTRKHTEPEQNTIVVIHFHRNLFQKFPINNKLVLFQIMVWYQTSNKKLFEPIVVWFTDAYASLYLGWIHTMKWTFINVLMFFFSVTRGRFPNISI